MIFSNCQCNPIIIPFLSANEINGLFHQVLEIPGYVYDSVKKRYFKQDQVHSKHFITKSETKCHDETGQQLSGLKPALKVSHSPVKNSY